MFQLQLPQLEADSHNREVTAAVNVIYKRNGDMQRRKIKGIRQGYHHMFNEGSDIRDLMQVLYSMLTVQIIEDYEFDFPEDLAGIKVYIPGSKPYSLDIANPHEDTDMNQLLFRQAEMSVYNGNDGWVLEEECRIDIIVEHLVPQVRDDVSKEVKKRLPPLLSPTTPGRPRPVDSDAF